MTKQTFEDQIIELIDDTTDAGVELTDEGTIGVGVTFDEDRVRAEAGRLYDELVAKAPTDEPEQPDESPAFTLQLDLDDQPAQSTQPETIGVYVTARDQNHAHLIVDVEAWQAGKKVEQAFVARQVLTRNQTAVVPVTLPRLAPGMYQLKAFVFEGPKDGTHEWGKKLWGNEDAGTLTVEAAPAYESTTPVTAGYARLPQQVDTYVTQYPELKAIADQPTGVWLGDWSGDIEVAARTYCKQAGELPPLFIVYNIPNRDTGEYSSGGKASPEAYRAWIDALAKGVGDHPAIYILEPDALGHLDRMTAEQQVVRNELLHYAAKRLTAKKTGKVYIDASMWVQPEDMAKRINAVKGFDGVVAGFSINTSNYKKLDVCWAYGSELSELTGLDYLIDTSRNGIGTDLGDGRWCNVQGQAIGERPDLGKGYVWAKCPGESDGPENGGPAAGEFWLEGALALVRNGR